MVETRSLTLSVSLEAEEFRRILMALSDAGWVPAMLHAERQFLRLAGLDDGLSLRLPPRGPLPRSARQLSSGDLFFRDGSLYYCINNQGPRLFIDSRGNRFSTGDDDRKLEIGLVSEKGPSTTGKLDAFSAAVKDAMFTTLDGRKTRHLTFEWQAIE